MKPREFWIDRHPESVDQDKLTHVVHFEPNLTGPMKLEQLHVREVIEISEADIMLAYDEKYNNNEDNDSYYANRRLFMEGARWAIAKMRGGE